MCRFTRSALQPMSLTEERTTCSVIIFVQVKAFRSQLAIQHCWTTFYPILEHILYTLALFRCHLCRASTHSLLVTLLEIVQTPELSHLSNTGVESCGGAPPSKVYKSVLSPLQWPIQEEADVPLCFA